MGGREVMIMVGQSLKRDLRDFWRLVMSCFLILGLGI